VDEWSRYTAERNAKVVGEENRAAFLNGTRNAIRKLGGERCHGCGRTLPTGTASPCHDCADIAEADAADGEGGGE
jgi:hypothetical protein